MHCFVTRALVIYGYKQYLGPWTTSPEVFFQLYQWSDCSRDRKKSRGAVSDIARILALVCININSQDGQEHGSIFMKKKSFKTLVLGNTGIPAGIFFDVQQFFPFSPMHIFYCFSRVWGVRNRREGCYHLLTSKSWEAVRKKEKKPHKFKMKKRKGNLSYWYFSFKKTQGFIWNFFI